jgi:ATP-binding cassette subfamily B protein
MFSINKILTISALLIFPVILAIVSLFGGRMVSQRKAQQESLSKLSDLIQEDLSGISAIKIYAQENAEKREFDIYNKAYRNSAIKLARTASTLFPLLQGISSISLLILLGLGTTQLETGFISIGGLVALILYVERLVFPTALLGFTLNTFQLGQVSLDRVEEIFLNNPNIVDGAKTKSLKRKIKGMLEAKELTLKYPGAKFNSLNGLNFKIYPGEIIAIVGPVGCGKTTLAKSLGRTIEIPDDQLFIDGIDVKNIKLEDLRKNISIVPQEAFLFTSSISENLRFGEPKASKGLVKKSAKKAGLIEDINNFPQKFKTIVGERGITLSGGQRQRTALGRALLVNSPILVLDDALASVDNKTAARIIDEMRERSNKTILMISHQLSVAATCDRVLVMDKGEIVQEGNHKDLVKKRGLYKQLWERELATNIVES